RDRRAPGGKLPPAATARGTQMSARRAEAGGGDRVRRALIGLLGAVVIALVGSWAWVQFGPGVSDHANAARGAWGSDFSPTGGAGPAPERVIRVQVLNGTREGGVGSRLASYLREGGFHVVEVKNADRSDYFATLVVSRRRDPSAARAVARFLGRPPVVLQGPASHTSH